MDGATGLPGGGRHGSASSGLVWLAVVVLTATGADWMLAVGTGSPVTGGVPLMSSRAGATAEPSLLPPASRAGATRDACT